MRSGSLLIGGRDVRLFGACRCEGAAQFARRLLVSQSAAHSNRSSVDAAQRSCKSALAIVAGFSGIVNVLMLAGSLYMLQVYDRVLTSGSVATLVGISLLLLLAYSLQGLLDGIRVRMLSRIGARFDEQVSPDAFASAQRLSLMGLSAVQAQQPIRDLDQIRAFLSSLGPTALFDMPWMPLFIAGCFVLHPWLGWLAVGGALVIVALTLLTEALSRTANRKQLESSLARQALAESSVRNAEALTAMGTTTSFQQQWTTANERLVRDWLEGSDASSGLGAFAKVFRMVLQSAVLGLGAFLAIRGEVSGGAMIAASIMTSRALAPLEIAVAHWKSFIASRQGLGRLRNVLETPSLADREPTQLPTPQHSLTATGLVVSAPGRALPILQGVSIDLKAGQGLAVIGPSASGKSTLARALVGVWQPLKGDVRLDGAAYDQWAPDHLGKHIGYLPQDIELFDGTVAENIARFDRDAQSAAIVAAARAAGAHDLILKLDQGYDTRIGEAGSILSGGQRQRIALARALYGEPFLVVLDEPNSNLDREGDDALTAAVQGVRGRGGIVVLVTHRPSAIAGVDQVAVMQDGRIQAAGPRDEILQQLMKLGGATAPAQRVA